MIEDNRYFWSHLKTRSVTVRVQLRKRSTGVVFRVGNMIDMGNNGRQMVMLEYVDYPQKCYARKGTGDVAIPFRMGHLDFVYTSLRKPEIRNVNNLLSTLYKDGEIEKIVPDVLCPGDLLVFKQEKNSLKIKMVEALRVVEHHMQKTKMAGHAL